MNESEAVRVRVVEMIETDRCRRGHTLGKELVVDISRGADVQDPHPDRRVGIEQAYRCESAFVIEDDGQVPGLKVCWVDSRRRFQARDRPVIDPRVTATDLTK